MGFIKLMYYVVIVTAMTFLALNHAPNLLDIEPKQYTPHFLKFEGALAVNKDLDKGEMILKDQLHGPESLEYKDGLIYASLENGKIVAIKDDKIVKTIADTTDGAKVPGRPLGMRFFGEDLYVADSERGLLKVDVKTGKVTVLVPTSMIIGGKKLTFADDLDIIDGSIYFSDMTTKWNSKSLAYGMMEHDNSGRVLKYSLATGNTEVVLDNLHFPNGVQAFSDKKSVLISEFLKNRILRYYISGPRKGQTEIFANLPGEPDNLRINSRGGYWVAMMSGRDASTPHLMDRLASYPKIKKALARLNHVLASALDFLNQYISSSEISTISAELKSGVPFMMLLNLNHPVVVELSPEGKIVRSLHSSNPKYALLSQPLELDGNLYLGSFIHPYIIKVKL